MDDSQSDKQSPLFGALLLIVEGGLAAILAEHWYEGTMLWTNLAFVLASAGFVFVAAAFYVLTRSSE